LVTHINYTKGYYTALCDVMTWFDNPSELLKPNVKKQVMFCLKKIWEERSKFMVEKADYDFSLSLEDQELFFGKAHVKKIREMLSRRAEDKIDEGNDK